MGGIPKNLEEELGNLENSRILDGIISQFRSRTLKGVDKHLGKFYKVLKTFSKELSSCDSASVKHENILMSLLESWRNILAESLKKHVIPYIDIFAKEMMDKCLDEYKHPSLSLFFTGICNSKPKITLTLKAGTTKIRLRINYGPGITSCCLFSIGRYYIHVVETNLKWVILDIHEGISDILYNLGSSGKFSLILYKSPEKVREELEELRKTLNGLILIPEGELNESNAEKFYGTIEEFYSRLFYLTKYECPVVYKIKKNIRWIPSTILDIRGNYYLSIGIDDEEEHEVYIVDEIKHYDI